MDVFAKDSIHERWHALALELGGSTLSLRNSWSIALQRISSTNLLEDDVERLARLSPSPSSLSNLAALLGQEADERIHLLKEAVDDSPYSLKEWLYSLDLLNRWATENGKETHFQHMLGYIHCCTQVDSSRPLVDIIEDMLTEYGYSGLADD